MRAIKAKSCYDITNIIGLMMCSKILDDSADVNNMFVKFSILYRSDSEFAAENYKKTLKKWNM